MKQLIVLIGVRGAGKTTVVTGFSEGKVLKPSTDRTPRFAGESEYHFEAAWDLNRFAWTIRVGNSNYGMRWEELNAIETVGITVFDPASLSSLDNSDVKKKFEIIKVGLDTVDSLNLQHARVGGNRQRLMVLSDFDSQRAVVKHCDIVLRGDAATVANAVAEMARLVGGRGGVLCSSSIRTLMAAGSLLESGDTARIEAASYDLQLADKYWCQGKFHTLSDADSVAVIPPYSFAIVKAKEVAMLPRFIVATFDVRVRLFFSGVILSNGPQVDPGYCGALFCMLHNASGTEVGINRGEHFATIQFQTLATNSEGYADHYQNKKGFSDFLDGTSSKRPGGQIFEHISTIAGKLEVDAERFRNSILVVAGLLAAALAIVAAVAYWAVDKAVAVADRSALSAQQAATEASGKSEAAMKQVSDAVDRLNKAVENARSAASLSEKAVGGTK